MPAGAVVAVEVEGKTFDQATREFEHHLIAWALTRTGCNRAAAARALGISQERLSVRLARSPVRLRAVVE
jgi:transcriptional regulator with PAS, ATPase and Fis domain